MTLSGTLCNRWGGARKAGAESPESSCTLDPVCDVMSGHHRDTVETCRGTAVAVAGNLLSAVSGPLQFCCINFCGGKVIILKLCSDPLATIHLFCNLGFNA